LPNVRDVESKVETPQFKTVVALVTIGWRPLGSKFVGVYPNVV
jgi:hypothetical protein